MKKITNSTNKLKNNRGFTLMEIMATVTLLSIIVTLVSTGLGNMELASITSENLDDVEGLFFDVTDALIQSHEDGSYQEDITTNKADSGKLWRGFNSASDLAAANPSYAGNQPASSLIGGYDVAFMVDYPDYIYEDPTTRIYYNDSYRDETTTGSAIDVYEGYQLPHLVGLIDPEPGMIQSYGILFELQTGTLIEVSLIKIPYDNSGTTAQTVTNARAAAKIAADILGSGVRDAYSNYIGAGAAVGMPDTNSVASTINPIYYTPTADKVNGYGHTHIFLRENTMSNISAEMLAARYNYAASRATVASGTITSYLDSFGVTIESQLVYKGMQ